MTTFEVSNIIYIFPSSDDWIPIFFFGVNYIVNDKVTKEIISANILSPIKVHHNIKILNENV